MAPLVGYIVLPLAGLILGWMIRWLYARFRLSSAEREAERVLQDAIKEAEAKKKEIDARIIVPLSHLIASGVRSGQFNEIDPVVGAKCLMATLQMFVIAAVEDLPANDLDADLEKVEAVFFKGIVKSREQGAEA